MFLNTIILALAIFAHSSEGCDPNYCSVWRLIHDDRARCIFACYRLADDDGMPHLHVTVVAYKWHWLVSFGSRIFAFLLTLHFEFLSVSTYLLRSWDSQISSPFANYRCILILNSDPHACRYDQNMFFCTCQTCKQILIIVLN